jgi:hypothetical protein
LNYIPSNLRTIPSRQASPPGRVVPGTNVPFSNKSRDSYVPSVVSTSPDHSLEEEELTRNGPWDGTINTYTYDSQATRSVDEEDDESLTTMVITGIRPLNTSTSRCDQFVF